jgi:hypothetical protein
VRSNLEDNIARRVRNAGVLYETAELKLTGSYRIGKSGPNFWYFDANSASRDVFLPPIEPGGGQFFVITNSGTAGNLLLRHDNGTLLFTTIPGSVSFIVSSKLQWFVVPMAVSGVPPISGSGNFPVFNDTVSGLIIRPIVSTDLPAAANAALGAVKAKPLIIGQALSFLDEGGTFGTSPIREFVSTNRVYFVRKDGNDNNDGSADDAAHAFLTIKKALNVVATLDFGGSNFITVSVGPGTYTTRAAPGAGEEPPVTLPSLLGDAAILKATTAGTATISGQSVAAVTANGIRGTWTVDGFILNTIGGSANCVSAIRGANVNLSNITFGACTAIHVSATNNGNIVFNPGTFTINGSASIFLNATLNASVTCGGRAFTLTGVPNFPVCFMQSIQSAIIVANGNTWNGVTNGTGLATGPRFNVASNGTIDTQAAVAGLNYLPGDAAGKADSATAVTFPVQGAAGGVYA